MLGVEVEFQIETLYSNGLKYLETPSPFWRGNPAVLSLSVQTMKNISAEKSAVITERQALALLMPCRLLPGICYVTI